MLRILYENLQALLSCTTPQLMHVLDLVDKRDFTLSVRRAKITVHREYLAMLSKYVASFLTFKPDATSLDMSVLIYNNTLPILERLIYEQHIEQHHIPLMLIIADFMDLHYHKPLLWEKLDPAAITTGSIDIQTLLHLTKLQPSIHFSKLIELVQTNFNMLRKKSTFCTIDWMIRLLTLDDNATYKKFMATEFPNFPILVVPRYDSLQNGTVSMVPRTVVSAHWPTATVFTDGKSVNMTNKRGEYAHLFQNNVDRISVNYKSKVYKFLDKIYVNVIENGICVSVQTFRDSFVETHNITTVSLFSNGVIVLTAAKEMYVATGNLDMIDKEPLSWYVWAEPVETWANTVYWDFAVCTLGGKEYIITNASHGVVSVFNIYSGKLNFQKDFGSLIFVIGISVRQESHIYIFGRNGVNYKLINNTHGVVTITNVHDHLVYFPYNIFDAWVFNKPTNEFHLKGCKLILRMVKVST